MYDFCFAHILRHIKGLVLNLYREACIKPCVTMFCSRSLPAGVLLRKYKQSSIHPFIHFSWRRMRLKNSFCCSVVPLAARLLQ
ncbi:hypothetical protein DUNSADRAFT_17325 [Dunaliella salina]|uniref:Encoded protein n=1 Tax=Dunaliella salina TaxID=3046 RepID=A0ABQ7G1X8_DUNSA|nr:hypothetical protein DUNSADRAFT_17325 [Dunaliella salina]|eukprot:KAF5828612.1 hypothetical protein DUNSADRAFT_17325 [Dunaliella salina]